ncbi:MAG TPA: VIT1/CCC1 transporter family protein [Acidimicrobiales bacterium]|nr:VIT1/CCC1 transporter family protein [Acidimicrobiales bacterium]
MADLRGRPSGRLDGEGAPAVREVGAPPEHHHRNVQGGAARAAVFGISDGLVSNVSLILGVAGANPAPGVVRLAGLAGLVAGAFSMAAGEYVSMKAQAELLERELDLERIEIARRPETERRELAAIYRSRGVEPAVADELATAMMSDPDLALETHAREELGIDPEKLGSPVLAALSSFLAFSFGALLPLVPWLITRGSAATAGSIVVGALAAIGIGVALSFFTGRSRFRSALRQLLIAGAAAAVTFAVGSAVGAERVV